MVKNKYTKKEKAYMKITSITDERVKAVFKIPKMSINWYATLNRFSGD